MLIAQVTPPPEVTETLSSTHWGAILLLTVFVMGSWIVYLAYMTRTLNKQMVDTAHKRTDDAIQDRERAETLLERAVTALTQASSTMETLKTKVCDQSRKIDKLDETVDQLRDKVAQCPTRGGGNG